MDKKSISFEKHNRLYEDLHVHTIYSKDSKEIPEKYLQLAIQKGISYLGFSDHIDLDPIDKDYGYYNYEKAYNEYKVLNDKYSGSINFLFGLEVTYQSFLEESIRNSIKGKDFDYLIGSVHRLDNFTISGPHGIGFFIGKTEEEAYNLYFDELEKMVEMRYFDIIGHFDVIKRYGKNYYGTFNAEKYEKKIKTILSKAIDFGMVIEVNSSGYRHNLNEPYPNYEIVQIYRDLGGRKIVIGSDAHNINHFGAFLEKTTEEVFKIYDFEIVVYNNRKEEVICHLSDIIKI